MKIYLLLLQLCCFLVQGHDFGDEPHEHAQKSSSFEDVVEYYCVGHGALHDPGRTIMLDKIKAFPQNIPSLFKIAERLSDDRPASRLCYFVADSELTYEVKSEIYNKCFQRAFASQWPESLYFFASKTDIMNKKELESCVTSSYKPLAIAATRKLKSAEAAAEHQLNSSENSANLTQKSTGSDDSSFGRNYKKGYIFWLLALTLILAVFISIVLKKKN